MWYNSDVVLSDLIGGKKNLEHEKYLVTVVQDRSNTFAQWAIENVNKGGARCDVPKMPGMNVPMNTLADPILTFVIIRRMRTQLLSHTKSMNL